VDRLEQLIRCKPDDYSSFEAAAQELLQECAGLQTCTNLADSNCDGFWDEQPSSTPDEEEAWRSVCEARAQMHAGLRESDQNEESSNRWRRRKQQHSHGTNATWSQVPIVPRVSLAFADAASAGRKQHSCPTLPAHAVAKPAKVSRARHQSGGTIVWIRQFDLRIHDNPCLVYAASLDQPVHLVFVWSEAEDAAQGKWRIGGTAASLWIYHALASLNSDYERWYGHRISFVVGSTTAAALRLAVQETSASTLVTSKAYDNAGRTAEEEVKQALHADNVTFQSFNSFLLNDVERIRIDMSEHRGHFGTLVPFLFACNAQSQPPKPREAPRKLPKADMDEIPSSVGLQGLGLCKLPVRCDGTVLDWCAPIVREWSITEDGARAALRKFLAQGGGLSRYETERHLADASAVARISPYLRFGMLSCRAVYWEASAANAKDIATTFWRRLVWRDLAYWQLRLFPHMGEEPIRDHYAGQKWNTDQSALHRWCQGRTGYPIVDAGMRELWATGWMSQNVRMVVALVLVEYLNIHWVEGARWFHHTLVDADPAINPMMWQNAGKSGLDQWNFTMHPAEFGRRMDPTGDYVRRWCPELASLPARFIHCPWEAPERLQKHLPTGVYPGRLIQDLDAAALINRSAIREQRARRRDRNDDGGYDIILLPKGSTLAHDGRRVRLFTKKDYRLPLRAKQHDHDRLGYKFEPAKR